jgi:hypothetical protein
MKRLAILCFAIIVQLSAQATHIRCGYISLKKISGLTYTITLTVYTNTGSPVRFAGGALRFGDGVIHTTPFVENTILPIYPNVGIVEYSIEHTFPKNGEYTISYRERNLTEGIVNIKNSVNTPFYMLIKTNLIAEEDSSTPVFLTHPILESSTSQSYSFSNAAFEKLGGYLRYDLGLVYQDKNILAPGLQIPKSLAVNYYNGTVTWDNKLEDDIIYVGDYLFALYTYQFNATGKLINTIQRTFQIILEDGEGGIQILNPVQDLNGKIFVESGKSKTVKVIMLSDASEKTWSLANQPAISTNITFFQYDSIVNSKPARVASVTLTSSPEIIRNEPYVIALRAKSGSDSNTDYKDVSFLFFTKDIVLPPKPDSQQDPFIAAKSETLVAYPNPFNDYLYFTKLPEDSNRETLIYNQLGDQVLSTTESTIDTSSLPAGFYILRFGVITTKLIKR